MKFSISNPHPDHKTTTFRTNLGSRPQGGRCYGTSARCSCGAQWKTNEGPPSGKGFTLARKWYLKHLTECLTEGESTHGS